VATLLQAGTDVDMELSPASPPAEGQRRDAYASVVEAAFAQDVAAVGDLLGRGFDVNGQDAEGNSALHWAAWFKLNALVSRLLERGARPDLANAVGETAVHLAAKASNLTALEVISGGDYMLLSPRDRDGMTPFIISALHDSAPVAEWLYLKGISVEEQDDLGRTALHWACYRGHPRTVQWLLSRSASIVHRDHDGMTAMHWAAEKGRVQVVEMLLNVGAVQMLDVPNVAGDTPIALATRKQQLYLVLLFHKCQLFQFVFGRPKLSQSHLANLFVCAMGVNIATFMFVLAPTLVHGHICIVLLWAAMALLAVWLWAWNYSTDPGWMQPNTILPQDHLIGDANETAFDAEQPVESQLARVDEAKQSLAAEGGERCGNLMRMELEQNSYNYQRHLLTEAQKRLGSGSAGSAGGGAAGYSNSATGPRSELQPLMAGAGGPAGRSKRPSAVQRAELENTSSVFRERERRLGNGIGRARVEDLLEQDGGKYLELLNKGEFKSICVVCRTQRTMRSHHCKDCGRCVERLDHHCPWIDNCVGLGNQRVFFFFVVALLLTILGFFYAVALWVAEALVPEVVHGSLVGLLQTIWSRGLFPALGPFMALGCGFLNFGWLLFVGALAARHAAYMAVNITTYEVLMRPVHVQQRFPKGRKQFWFLKGFRPLDALRHCTNYWTLNMDDDEDDFGSRGSGDVVAEQSRDPSNGPPSDRSVSALLPKGWPKEFGGGQPRPEEKGAGLAGSDVRPQWPIRTPFYN